MATPVQLRGKEQVIDAYNNANVDVWAVYSYKSLLTKGVGAESLGAFLDLICKNATEGIYTLKIYEDLTDAKQVKEKTEASGSLAFKFTPDDFEAVGSPLYAGRMENSRVWNELQEIKKQLAEKEEPQTLEEAAIGLLQNPGETAQLVVAFKELISAIFSKPAGPAGSSNFQNAHRPASVAGLPNTSTMPRELTQTEKDKIAAAVDVLIDKDPKIADHLDKLASIATNSPSMFQMLLTTLENFK